MIILILAIVGICMGFWTPLCYFVLGLSLRGLFIRLMSRLKFINADNVEVTFFQAKQQHEKEQIEELKKLMDSLREQDSKTIKD